jgi:general secretion pathway protein K
MTQHRSPQRGAALLTAMLIVVLVSTLASAMIWQQWRAVQVEAAERARTQSALILTGALDWARLILKEDTKATALTEPWATPLAEARLSTFLAADKNNTDDGPEAFLSGRIADAQARYNLRNLVAPDSKAPTRNIVQPAELATLQKLFASIGVNAALAPKIANGLRDALPAASAGGIRSQPPVLLPRSLEQLTWLGVDADSLRRMAPYVVILPNATPVNLNTASREVIAASIDGLDMGAAEGLVQKRQRAPFKGLQDAQELIPLLPIKSERANVGPSTYFEVRGRLRLGDRALEELTLVERRGVDFVPVFRQRVSHREGVE